ncbi:DUF2931 family protein [Dyella flava]|uniref:DUF2931 family protein n=1 Tax=Dyella flava TaxID=1920170 RepID=A0ABS2JYY4_9GAMM|nr:DUF2931 family protein [Dyella flava]MBM7124196.1 DUF2931 family protein [Dyella flava]GLQ50526.1 hypothetical protein GCM10010872_19750 [Dyella flava]
MKIADVLKRLLPWLALFLAGCALTQSTPRNGLPYDSWYLGFRAPARMEVWLETADIEDTQGRIFVGMMQGIVALAYRGDPVGWGPRISSGAGRDIYNAGLPKRIYVRWQSLVEPQTYRAIIEIPEQARQMMLTKVQSVLRADDYEYQSDLSIGLAPGGWIKVWVKSPASRAVEVLCMRAQIEPKGPYQGHYNGEYVRLNPEIHDYLKTHTIPYDSWKCPGM